ncbi:HAD hydrolase-like protein [Rhodococcus fascians]|nr:HAD hydrolase-like protein [Rhodococcus fascians]MBY4396410.1 HAD hydrolase-like protein [Rhodococcus fascians]MBY4409062.1 HAD hydrolase-like protein [Rhodococcus fascians]MBY4420912.1 HAD hydrolase-like protein [Rhodococcus fascians]MBY4460265.1 HAD hydrolase-like protein [Rhodococcus fascians]
MSAALPASVVLFDLDGTLTDSAPGIHAGFRHALASVGAPAPTEEQLSLVVGPPLIDTLRAMNLGEEAAQRALAAYFDRYDERGWAENTAFDGIEAVLTRLQDRGIRLGVATSKSERFAIRILDHFGLSRYFDFIGGASNDGSRRAKSDVIAHSLINLGIAPVESTDGGTAGVIMIGDRDHDVHGAARFGIPAVYVEWGYGIDGESDDAAFTASDMDELAAVLEQNTQASR